MFYNDDMRKLWEEKKFILKLVEENGELCLELKEVRKCLFSWDDEKLVEVDFCVWLLMEFMVLGYRFGKLYVDLLLSFLVKIFCG